VVARVEAFIAGWGLQEALTRAEAYRNAGADAILIHSKKSDPSDIEAFMSEWNSKVNSNLYARLEVLIALCLRTEVLMGCDVM
jgi:2-methylisocitrate lyase-like PEP mutase family enzyme